LPSIARVVSSAVVLVLALATPAAADDGPTGPTGGTGVPEAPEVEQVVCADDDKAWSCAPGETVTVEGDALDAVHRVRFLGRAGRDDDRSARPVRRQEHRLEVRVPSTASSGPVAVVADGGHDRTGRWLKLASPEPAPTARAGAGPAATVAVAVADGMTFPIVGEHRYGTATNHFGGGRGHQGEDVFAACGTPLVALVDATVQHRADGHARAGNYLVLQGADGQSYAYMHLQAPALVAKGAKVRAGQRVGAIGDTGRASGCHLHFEQWTAPGWYTGGRAIDPLPLLRRLDPAAPRA
jgi:murein DD-endopeptidase MepM/ murein hydrolase activator NlpD